MISSIGICCIIIHKLYKSGLGCKFVKMIISIFDKANARVRWNGEIGKKIDSTHGVLQGSIISPKSFN